MDCTQALDDDFGTHLCTSDNERKQVGWLEVGDARHEVFHGDNRIGREPSLCQIVIDSKTLSKEHAVIEVLVDGTAFIYDLGSLNKTRLGKTVLQPEARYQLLDGSEVLFADIKAVYKIIPGCAPDDDSGSETGSESMLNISAAEDNMIPATPAPTRLKPSVIEETIIENEAEDKQKPTFKSPEAPSTQAPASNTGNEQLDEEANDIYEAETQADEFYASVVLPSEINDSSKDGLNITDDIFAAETQCDENDTAAETQGNETKDKSINKASRDSNTASANQEKSICEAENQSLDHISPSQSNLKQSNINKLDSRVTVSTNITFEDDKSLSTSSKKVELNSKTSCGGKSLTLPENNNFEKNNNCNKVDASRDSSEAPVDNVNSVLDTGTAGDVDDSIYEADTLCMESGFQLLTPKRPVSKKNTIEESESEEDITEMPTQYIDWQPSSSNQQKLAKSRGSPQDISEKAAHQIDLQQSAPTKQLKSPETKDIEGNITEMATQNLDLEPASSKESKSSETKDAEQDITEMATQHLDLEPASSNECKSSETKDAEQDITEMATQRLDYEPASSNQYKSTETKYAEQDISEMATLVIDVLPASSNQSKRLETKDTEQHISEMATQHLDLELASLNQYKSLETKDTEQDISEMATQHLDLEPASSNQRKSLRTKDTEQDISEMATQHLDLKVTSTSKLKPAKIRNSKLKNLCAQVGNSESEAGINKSDKRQENVEDPSSPSLLQEDNEDLNEQEQKCSNEYNKKDKQLKDLNESSGKDKVAFPKGYVNKGTYKTAQDKVATDSGNETDSDNIFEAQTQLICENNTATTSSKKSRDMHAERQTKKENDVSESAETKSSKVVEDDEDTKSEDLYETHLQARTEEDRSSSYSSMINNTKSSEKNPDLEKLKECNKNGDSVENDDIYEASTQIIDFDRDSKTSANINLTKKCNFENKMSITKRQGNRSKESTPKDCANRNITRSKNSRGHSDNNSEIITNSKECNASVLKAEETGAQRSPKVPKKAVVLNKVKPAKKEKVSTNLEEQDSENIFEAATQVIEDQKPVSPEPLTSKMLNLSEKTAVGSKPTKRNKITKVELKTKQEDTGSSSDEVSEILNQVSRSTENDDSFMNAPTQILNKETCNMLVNNVTLNQSADTGSSKYKDEQDFQVKTHHKSRTPKKGRRTADNKSTTSMSELEENQRTTNEMQDQVSPTRHHTAEEEVAVSPLLLSRISKRAPVGKRRGNRNISSVIAAEVAKTRNKKAAGISKQNQSVKDENDQYCSSSTSSILESSVEAKQNSSKEIWECKKSGNQGNKAEDSASKKVSVHSKNKVKDTSESPTEDSSRSLRPSRQRKMTWKVRETLLSDQETSDSDKSGRRRNATVLDNSDTETSTPIKARKETSTKSDKPTTRADSVSEHSSDLSHSRAIGKRGKPDLMEQGSSYQNDEMKENASQVPLSTSNRAKRKASDLQFPSSSKRSKGEAQKSFTERENPTEDSNATLLAKKDKNTESKTDVRTRRTTRSKRGSITEVAVATKQTTVDKNKSKNLKKQNCFSNVIEPESESESDLEVQACVSTKSKIFRDQIETVKESKLDLENQEKENKLSSVTASNSKSDLPQRRSRRAAKEVENEKCSKIIQLKNIVEESLDPVGNSKENKNDIEILETQEKNRSSSRRKRKASSVDTVSVENEDYSESPGKRRKTNSRKASGKQMELSDNTPTSTPSTCKSSTPNKRTPGKLSRKRGKSSIISPEKKKDQSHSENDRVNIDSNDDTPTTTTPKRTSRRGNTQNTSSSETLVSTPQRSTPRRAARSQESECYVLFTGISDSKQEAIVKSLGGTVVDLPESCTVLVTDKVRRTFKFLCIMGKGKPIVSPTWLTQSKQAGKFLDPWKYLIKDQESETKFHFSLKNSLERASKTNLLAGYNIFVTPKVLPPPPEMRGIVESCGGTYIPHWPSSSWPEKSFIISCKEDKAQWNKLKKSGKPIVGAEILLLGILQQKLDIKSNTLA